MASKKTRSQNKETKETVQTPDSVAEQTLQEGVSVQPSGRDVAADAEQNITEKTKEKSSKKDEFYHRGADATDGVIPDAHAQDFWFAPRKKEAFGDSALLYERLGYKKAQSAGINMCDRLLDLKSENPVGVIPKLRFSEVWDLAQNYAKNHPDQSSAVKAVTKEEWDAAYKKIDRALAERVEKSYNAKKRPKKVLLIQDFWTLSEITYQSLFIKKADKIVELVKAAILYDIEENGRIIRKWRKIKKYKHTVGLSVNEGGIFSKSDVEILQKHNIHSLNDIRRANIYLLKNMMLSHSLTRIVEELNEAFKEDLARRRDRRYRIYPFLFGDLALVAMAVLGYKFQYTLIKNEQMTLAVNGVSLIWLIALFYIIGAQIRSFKRRKKHPKYRYFDKVVKRRSAFFVLLASFSIISLGVFYQRYDGYNDLYYYTLNADGETISVAGLVPEGDEAYGNLIQSYHEEILTMPESIDGKTVTAVASRAFEGDEFACMNLPASVTTIGKSAFQDCEYLTTVNQSLSEGAEGVSVIGKKAFKDCLSLKQTNISESVKEIGNYAFKGCLKIRSIGFENLEILGEGVFAGCSNLSNVSLGENLTMIPEETFQDCIRLSNVQNTGLITEIGGYAFENCISMKDYALDGVKIIGKKAFFGCAGFEYVVVPETVEEIGKKAFGECGNMQQITLPFIGKNAENAKKYSLDYVVDVDVEKVRVFDVILTGMTTVYSENFQDCTAVKKLSFSEGLEKIEKKAFKKSGIRVICLPDTLTVIEANAFEKCENLVEIQGGNGVERIEQSAFIGCSSLPSVYFKSVKTIEKNAFKDCVSLADVGELVNVQSVGDYAFENCQVLNNVDLSAGSQMGEGVFKDCTSLSQVILPTEMTVIPEETFLGCTNLYAFTMSDRVETIAQEAFRECGLQEIVLGNSVTEIGKKAFYGCNEITSLSLPETVKKIGDNAFGDCIHIQEVTLPFIGQEADSPKSIKYLFGSEAQIARLTVTGMSEVSRSLFKGAEESLAVLTLKGVVTIKDNTFEGFEYLRSVYADGALRTIGKEAFQECNSLQGIVIPEGVTVIEEGAFRDCVNLYGVTLPETLTTIGESAFRSCSQLLEIAIPDNVNEIGEYAFRECGALTRVTLPKNISVLRRGVFLECESLYSIVLPDSVTKIEKTAFQDCSEMTSVTFSSSLTEIGDEAFSGCFSLYSVLLPESVKRIGEKAFYHCYAMEEVLLYTGLEEIGDSAFRKCSSLTELYVPESVQEIGSSAFNECSQLRYLSVPFIGKSQKSAKAVTYFAEDCDLWEIQVTNATKIASKAFKNMSDLQVVELNESCTEIGSDAFAGCYGVKVVIPSPSVEEKNQEVLVGVEVYRSRGQIR